jgi:imidazolonepropionase-like amidohydrolase
MQILTRSFRAILAAGGVALLPAAVAAQDIAIRNATLITITGGDIENGTIVVRNGKISAVGRNVNIPAGVRTIDGTGKFVMPGIIDAHSHAALENGITLNSTRATGENVGNYATTPTASETNPAIR